MPDSTFENLMSVRQRAAEAFVSGDGTKLDSLVPHDGMASWHSPRGDTVIGAENVKARYIKEAASFHSDGTTHFEIIQQGRDGNLGFWTGFQVATVRIGDAPRPVTMRLRVTEIFRKIDGAWKLVHHHADLLTN
jgi:ketosteroid isomerase-like protein